MLCAALPGCEYIYQGEELGLDEVQDIPLDQRTDPMFLRSNGTDPGRDGCRVPLPWSGARPPFGFSPAGVAGQPWLPQPLRWAALTVEAEGLDPDSMLNLYKTMLRIRRSDQDLRGDHFRWLPSTDDVLTFARGDEFVCVVNLSHKPIELPSGNSVALASAELSAGLLPPDATAWLRAAPANSTHGTSRHEAEGGE
jgi:alpha-glucosidase